LPTIFPNKEIPGPASGQSGVRQYDCDIGIQNRIAESYGATCFRVLTGFKYIGEKIRQFEADNTYSYVFGGEESYGFLVGTAVRDKDAVSAASMTAEMALWKQESR
jgi:phosphoglucomutase